MEFMYCNSCNKEFDSELIVIEMTDKGLCPFCPNCGSMDIQESTNEQEVE